MRRWKNEIVVQLLLLLGCENMERREKRPPGRDGEGRAGLPINRTYSHSPDAHPDCRADCCSANKHNGAAAVVQRSRSSSRGRFCISRCRRSTSATIVTLTCIVVALIATILLVNIVAISALTLQSTQPTESFLLAVRTDRYHWWTLERACCRS